MIRFRSKLLRLLSLGLAGSFLLAVAGCSPDVTAGRLQKDVNATFENTFAAAQHLAGQRASTITPTSTCSRTGVHTANAGAGSWLCVVTYTDPRTGRAVTDTYGVGVDNTSCYTATDGALAQDPYLKTSSGAEVTNPLFQFDGCFGSYGN